MMFSKIPGVLFVLSIFASCEISRSLPESRMVSKGEIAANFVNQTQPEAVIKEEIESIRQNIANSRDVECNISAGYLWELCHSVLLRTCKEQYRTRCWLSQIDFRLFNRRIRRLFPVHSPPETFRLLPLAEWFENQISQLNDAIKNTSDVQDLREKRRFRGRENPRHRRSILLNVGRRRKSRSSPFPSRNESPKQRKKGTTDIADAGNLTENMRPASHHLQHRLNRLYSIIQNLQNTEMAPLVRNSMEEKENSDKWMKLVLYGTEKKSRENDEPTEMPEWRIRHPSGQMSGVFYSPEPVSKRLSRKGKMKKKKRKRRRHKRSWHPDYSRQDYGPFHQTELNKIPGLSKLLFQYYQQIQEFYDGRVPYRTLLKIIRRLKLRKDSRIHDNKNERDDDKDVGDAIKCEEMERNPAICLKIPESMEKVLENVCPKYMEERSRISEKLNEIFARQHQVIELAGNDDN